MGFTIASICVPPLILTPKQISNVKFYSCRILNAVGFKNLSGVFPQ